MCADLLTGIYFWNRSHLEFNSQNFNNIITPVAGIIAVVIYGLALFITLKQNKIILSQNLKPHFERNIDELLIEAKSTVVGTIDDDANEVEYTILNYTRYIHNLILKLSNNADYKEDYENIYEGNVSQSTDYFQSRSYFSTALELNGFIIGHFGTSFFYDKIVNLVDEIESSQMIEDDKKLLLKRIKNTFVNEYISLVSFFKNYKRLVPPVPFVVGYEKKAEFQHLSDSEAFVKHYDIFIKRFADL